MKDILIFNVYFGLSFICLHIYLLIFYLLYKYISPCNRKNCFPKCLCHLEQGLAHGKCAIGI